MATFMLTCEHPAEVCEALFQEQQQLGTPDVYKGRDFLCSCPFGEHNGWVVVEGETGEAILASLPPLFRSHAKARQIETMVFT